MAGGNGGKKSAFFEGKMIEGLLKKKVGGGRWSLHVGNDSSRLRIKPSTEGLENQNL